MKTQHSKKWTAYLDLKQITKNQDVLKGFFVQKSIGAFMKKASGSTFLIESNVVEIVKSILCNSNGDGNNWTQQFIVVEEDLIEIYNGQMDYLYENDWLYKIVVKNLKQFNLVVRLLARGISFRACCGILDDVAQESGSRVNLFSCRSLRPVLQVLWVALIPWRVVIAF